MSHNQDPPGKRASRRLAPEELAREVARRLKNGPPGQGEHRRRRGFDVVTIGRLLMVLGIVALGAGTVYGVTWIGRVSYETTGRVSAGSPVFGCPGEPESGAVFAGEIVEVVGRTDDQSHYVLRDSRGPGGLVFVDAVAIDSVEDPDRLRVRTCEPRTEAEVAAEVVTSSTVPSTGSTPTTTVTTFPEGPTTTVGPTGDEPPRRRAPGSGASPPTTSPGTPVTTIPGLPTTTPGTGGTTPVTGPGTPPTTSPTTTTTTTSATTPPSTTSTTPTTTTTEPTTTTTESSTTTTTTLEATTTTTVTTTTTTDP
jgi:hypothetical protein